MDLAAQYGAQGHWLDIGCGAGILLDQAAARGFTGEGIELNSDRRAIAARVTGMPTHGLPVEELKFPDAAFDVVGMINVFSHLTSPTATLAEIRRVLKPGGLLVWLPARSPPVRGHRTCSTGTSATISTSSATAPSTATLRRSATR